MVEVGGYGVRCPAAGVRNRYLPILEKQKKSVVVQILTHFKKTSEIHPEFPRYLSRVFNLNLTLIIERLAMTLCYQQQLSSGMSANHCVISHSSDMVRVLL